MLFPFVLLLLLLVFLLLLTHTKQERFKNFENGHHQFMENIETLKKNVKALYAHYQNIGAQGKSGY